MSATDRRMASWSASPMRQKTVSRMIIGGSAGLRMMIALPRAAPPTTPSPRAVVRVNSSMLAPAPGPARLGSPAGRGPVGGGAVVALAAQAVNAFLPAPALVTDHTRRSGVGYGFKA